MPKKNLNIAAVIDIGSNEIRLKIGHSKKSGLYIIESTVYPLSIGRDTFTTGKISFEKADKACSIIKNFCKISSEYGAEQIRVIATSAIREAENKAYILDQIYLKTGVSVEIIDNQEEKFYIYKLMFNLLDKECKQSAMMVYIGSGNLGISIIDKEKIPLVQNIRIGSLRLTEMFENLHDYSREFYVVVEEYLDGFTNYLQMYLPENINTFIACGNEILLIAELCGETQNGNFLYIKKENFMELYESVKYKSVSLIMQDYNLPIEKAELLFPAMGIYSNLLEFTNADTIISPHVYLLDAVLYEMLYPDDYIELNRNFYKNTSLCAKTIAIRFGCAESHCNRVERYSLKIYDKLKKIHGLGQKERILLQSSAILHDIGKMINGRNHYKNSYNIVRGLDIVGLNDCDLEIVACVCLYHGMLIPSKNDAEYMSLSEHNKVITSKLASILRLADSLDRGHGQKFEDIEVKISENELQIHIETNKNIELEEWSFQDKSRLFEEVFGLKSVIKRKRTV